MDRAAASQIIQSMRLGVPPVGSAAELTVGREAEVSYFAEKLDELAEVRVSDVKFISAQIGAGKSHFLDVVASLAKDRNFVVSKVDLDSRATRFDHFEEVYARIIGNIATKEWSTDGLGNILEAWTSQFRDVEPAWIQAQLRQIQGLPLQLRSALYACALATSKNDDPYGAIGDLAMWLSGAKISAAQKKRLNVTAPVGRTMVADTLNGLMTLFRHEGYSGFVVLLDEAEAITSLARIKDRDTANENIRAIIDGAGSKEGFFFVFATTPSFLDPSSAKGAATYQALWRRIRPALGGRGSALDQPIIELPNLTADEYRQLAERIRDIAAIARRKPSTITDEQLARLADYARERASEQLSTLVRATVQVTDEAYADPDFDFDTTYVFLVEESAVTVDEDEIA